MIVADANLLISLVTEDQKILRTCPDVARSMGIFLGLPNEPADKPGLRSP